MSQNDDCPYENKWIIIIIIFNKQGLDVRQAVLVSCLTVTQEDARERA